jgi:hypothetical protein
MDANGHEQKKTNRRLTEMYADGSGNRSPPIFPCKLSAYIRVHLRLKSFVFVSIRVHSRLFGVHSWLHHWAESSDDLGETSGYLAERTVFNAIDQLRESVTSVFNDCG